MRKSLGKIILILFCINYIFADDDISYKFNIPNKLAVNNKEAIYLEFDVKQLQYDGKIIFFKFNIKENSNFDIHFLQLNEVNKPNNKHLKYSYLIYPKQSGIQKLEFSLFIQKTNEDGLKPGYEGDRDNVLGMVSRDSYAKIKPIIFDVKYAQKNKKLFGNFQLESHIDKQIVKAYEPVYVSYTLSGNGFDPKIDDLFKDQKDLEYFVDIQAKDILYTKNSTQIKYIYKYAFISASDFSIPSLRIDNLTSPKFDIQVKAINKKELIDQDIQPPSAEQKQKNYIDYILYLIIFISGYITSWIIMSKRSIFKSDSKVVEEKPEDIKDDKQRLLWMIKTNKQLYKEEIEQLSSKLF